jgi:hypothetical protein
MGHGRRVAREPPRPVGQGHRTLRGRAARRNGHRIRPKGPLLHRPQQRGAGPALGPAFRRRARGGRLPARRQPLSPRPLLGGRLPLPQGRGDLAAPGRRAHTPPPTLRETAGRLPGRRQARAANTLLRAFPARPRHRRRPPRPKRPRPRPPRRPCRRPPRPRPPSLCPRSAAYDRANGGFPDPEKSHGAPPPPSARPTPRAWAKSIPQPSRAPPWARARPTSRASPARRPAPAPAPATTTPWPPNTTPAPPTRSPARPPGATPPSSARPSRPTAPSATRTRPPPPCGWGPPNTPNGDQAEQARACCARWTRPAPRPCPKPKGP